MVLTKEELLPALHHEVQVLAHLASKVDPAKLDYRPTPRQRTLRELLQHPTIMGPIHLRAALGEAFDPEEWKTMWQTGEAAAKEMNLEGVKAAIGGQTALFAELLGPCPDADLRADKELFGSKASRGAWIVRLVLVHYAACRRQLFLYLKASGREELNTMNLGVGTDGRM